MKGDMREPARIVAAIEIATAMRHALADELERHRSTGWEDDILMLELGRVLGAMLRWQDARPSAVDHLVDSIRRVHAGLNSLQTPDPEEVVRELCPEASAEAGSADSAGGTRSMQ